MTQQYPLLNVAGDGDFAVTTAGTFVGEWLTGLDGIESVSAQIALNYGSGGSTINVYLQTSLDGGTTAIDIANRSWTTASETKVMNFFTDLAVTAFTPTDGALTANTEKNGILGNRLRLKIVVTGTYANTVVSGRVVVR